MFKTFLNCLKFTSKLHDSSALSHFNNSFRHYATRKRFYRNTGILRSEGKYEITLDQRKLKTPQGNLFSVESEPLAIAVATEWNSQKENIIQSKMHLTTLCNTVIDNPNNLTKYDMVNHITNYLDTDTILFQADEEKDLLELQEKEWDPVIDWFNKRFEVNIKKSQQMDAPPASEKDKATLSKHLLSHNFATICGFMYGVDTLKSVILTLACVEHFLTPEKAVLLSRLEEEYQTGHWGRVEWAHDLNQQDLQARLAAVILLTYFNNQSSKIKSKAIQ
ncbi:ATP synthase mitochondrial F1 complex assembly factor 2 [Tribolium madens]|uniref:ATP synthase mitochondrial F1 complex assembly factor 2 n=1 Tax=Tribolium madens TaxID=41895 RepID=UPI001CF7591C|nr:ATP synthase mitochondrial F1 complex assembly factor 2 [Tribolium madens]